MNDNQIEVPPSFIALYCDARGRLSASAGWVRARYELCEDSAAALVEPALALAHAQAPDDGAILRSMHAGLVSAESGLTPSEARWVVMRLAELLDWPAPAVDDAV
ncbi:hypothetical protein [Ottowia testudinis]|uniref:ATPase with chaperone activity n=1 Tax=Ottowia testudinis TaxID=2816950 RepID=A0A975CCL9_9BURK|nr:hypothetical protein [Ottowia testudinis]QTD43988.1 hypothetical protein J1M35_12650 [Ottowia testudinis]